MEVFAGVPNPPYIREGIFSMVPEGVQGYYIMFVTLYDRLLLFEWSQSVEDRFSVPGHFVHIKI